MVSRIRHAPNLGNFVAFVTRFAREKKGSLAFVFLFLLAGYEMGVVIPPVPTQYEIIIRQGSTAKDIAHTLKEAHIIRSEQFFVLGVTLLGIHNKLGAGTFVFPNPTSLISVIRELSIGGKETVLLVHEGDTSKEIAYKLNTIRLDGSGFLALVNQRHLEGYLFPDTYRFFEHATALAVVEKLYSRFQEKVAPLTFAIAKSGHTEEEIINMAAIVESEVRIPEDRRVISGILWKRLDANMPLQVDVAPETYTKKGLPKSPIANPGLDAIDASLNPKETAYWYYLSGKDGKTHFARTFEEHKLNKAKYLR